jgi:hypothetical protein
VLGVISDAIFDTIKMIPFMVLIFVVIEFFEHKFSNNLKPILRGSQLIGPVIGSVLGIFPQCGFSVMATILYVEGAVTTGTLIAVYLSTSDEAIPVILSRPDKINIILPLLLTKLAIGILAGYIIDISYLLLNRKRLIPVSNVQHAHEEEGCCGSTCIVEEFKLLDVIKHSFLHSVKVLTYVFLISVLLNITLFNIGSGTLSSVLLNGSVFQPVLTSIIGLIPSCASSVAIIQVFLSGNISFGSAIAGLSTSAGLGLIVLFKESKSNREKYAVVFLLLTFGILSGILLNAALPVNFLLK